MDDDQILRCVFCGEAEPDDAHLKTHNYLDCRGRLPEERTFTRKDHLGQHLRLVHNVKPKDLDGPLAQWKMPAPDIRSRCGFCDVSLDTWKARVDHLADHFKAGNTMADWKGNWGFDENVLARLESSIPPYFISTERNTPFPFEASNPLSESPCNAYELIEVELMHFVQVDYERSKRLPTSDELQLEACRIVFASEVLSEHEGPGSSWLRDLIMSSEIIERQARFNSLRSSAESRLPLLKIIGQDTLFEACPLEAQLRAFAGPDQSKPLTDQELQQEASRIIRQIEDQSRCPAEFIANWLIELAGSSTGWLTGFRTRAQIPHKEASVEPTQWPTNSSKIDSIMKNYSELERRLSEYVDLLQAHGIEVDDKSLERQAQSIIDEFDDEEWKRVASSNESWLMSFKRRYTSGRSTQPTRNFAHLISPPIGKLMSKSAQTAQSLEHTPDQSPLNTFESGRSQAMVQPTVTYGHLNTHNTNFHRWVAVELARWVASTMSPNNPNQHVPTDEELQHQARFIFYDDDDPWNQTPADNEEWLRQFKLDVGIFKELSTNNTA